jgi:23S rRNA (pseudouridine1915-N3)-methyltransferase
MRIHLLTVGSRRPQWEQQGYQEYARRLPKECALELREIPLARPAGRSSRERRLEEEGTRLLKAVPAKARVIGLDERGQSWNSQDLAKQLQLWLEDSRDIALLVGGPDGLAKACKTATERCWSLSPMTLPHGLVRILVAEQLYRAWTILQGHPYHRD